MAQKLINIGTSANAGNGDPIRTAFEKTNDNFTDLYQITANIQNGIITLSTTVQGDLQGSIFGDDSSVIIDAVAGEVRGNINNDRVKTNIIETKSITADSFVGSVFADDSTLIIDGQTGEVTGTFIGNLTGNVVGYLDGDMEGSVFGDDSTLLVDGVNSLINLNGTVKGNIIPNADETYDIGSSTNRFKDLYLKGSTINLGGLKLQNSGGLSLGLDLIGGEAFGAGWWDTQWFVIGPKTSGPEIKVRIDDTPADADNQAWIDFLKNIQPGDTFTIETPVQQVLTVTSTVTEDHFSATQFRFYFGVDVAPSIAGNDTYVYKVSTSVSPNSNLKIKYTPTTPSDWGYGTTPTNVSGALDLLADWVTNRDIANITGSVFGDDSTLLVDGVNNKIPAVNLSGALPAIDGSSLTGVISLATLKAEVAASADFADFQTRIAAL